MKTAFITGISGQDGSYLAEYLLEQNYTVHGLIRPGPAEQMEPSLWRLHAVRNRLTLHTAPLLNTQALTGILKDVQPDECYHLAAQSFAGDSPHSEMETIQTNVDGTHSVLLAIRNAAPHCRVFFAGSAQMFGDAPHAPQTEATPFRPINLYGVSKVAAYDLVQYYMRHHHLFVSTGLLYNHESPRRSFEFVTRKITASAARIKLGLQKELRLGNLDSVRDWGFAGDYVVAMHAALNVDAPGDYVIATGETHRIRDLLERVFAELELEVEPYVVQDEEFFRPTEKVPLVGDATRARERLGWEPKMPFEDWVRQMAWADMDYFQKLTAGGKLSEK